MALDFQKYSEMVHYTPHAEQRRFHESNARFKIASCGRRFGKSTMAARDMGSKLFLPKKWYWIVGPTYDLAEKEFRIIWDDLIVGRKLGRDKRVKKAYNKKQGEMHIQFPWGTRVECRSARYPQTLVGEGLDGVIVSEAAKHTEDTWKRYLRPALADKRGWASFATTPEGYNWFYRLWQLGQKNRNPAYESWTFPSWANTAIYPGGEDDPEIAEMRNTTAKEWFEQEIAAIFSSFVGKIYGEFDETVHVGDVPFDPALPNYIVFDWGFTNPLAAVEFQVTPNDQVRVWRIHKKAFATVYEHCLTMKARTQPEGYRIDVCFGDSADPAACQDVTRWLAPCFASPDAKANWREGVDLVKTFMKLRQTDEDEYGTPQYTPGLIIDKNCYCGCGCESDGEANVMVDEFNSYKSKEPINGNNVPEVGQKANDHCLDALRYGVMHVFKLGAAYHLGDVYDPSIIAGQDGWGQTASGLTVPTSDTSPLSESVFGETGIFTMEGTF